MAEPLSPAASSTSKPKVYAYECRKCGKVTVTPGKCPLCSGLLMMRGIEPGLLPASSKPRAAANKPGKSSKWAIAGVVFVVLAAIGAVTGGSSGSGSSDPTAGAGSACQNYIELLLKAPDTAKWDGDYTTKNDDGTVTNSGLVSSENGFGALVQSSYSCTLTGSPDSGWTVENGSVD